MMQVIEKKVLKMKKGEIAVVKSNIGVHIIKLIEFKSHKTDEKKAYKEAEQILKNKKLKEKLTEWLKELRNKAVIVKKL